MKNMVHDKFFTCMVKLLVLYHLFKVGTRGTNGVVHACTTLKTSICKGLEISGTKPAIQGGARLVRWYTVVQGYIYPCTLYH
jgi:hypothetical protein